MRGAVEPLIFMLKDEDRYVRAEAIKALGMIGDPIAIGPLTQNIDPLDSLAMLNAVYAFGRIGEPALDVLINGLTSDTASIRAGAAKSLGYIPKPEVINPLIDVLDDPDWQVRLNAVVSLGSVGNEVCVKPLIPLLKDENRFVRLETAKALSFLADRQHYRYTK